MWLGHSRSDRDPSPFPGLPGFPPFPLLLIIQLIIRKVFRRIRESNTQYIPVENIKLASITHM